MAAYINYRGAEGVETVDEFDSAKEANEAIMEYRESDKSGRYWVSPRPTKEWKKSSQSS